MADLIREFTEYVVEQVRDPDATDIVPATAADLDAVWQKIEAHLEPLGIRRRSDDDPAFWAQVGDLEQRDPVLYDLMRQITAMVVRATPEGRDLMAQVARKKLKTVD